MRFTFSQLRYFTTVQQPERFLLRSEQLTVMSRRIADLATLQQRVPLVRVDVVLEAVVIAVVLLGSAGVSPALSIHRAFYYRCGSERSAGSSELTICGCGKIVDRWNTELAGVAEPHR